MRDVSGWDNRGQLFDGTRGKGKEDIIFFARQCKEGTIFFSKQRRYNILFNQYMSHI